MQGMRCQRLSARPSSLGRQGCRDTFLQGPVSGARTDTGMSVKILVFLDPGRQHHSLRSPVSRTLQLLLQGGSERLSPEGPGVISELRAAAGLWQCLAGPTAWRHSHTCNEPRLFSAPCFLLLADGTTLPPGREGYF